jgi:integrase/recombinase XerD
MGCEMIPNSAKLSAHLHYFFTAYLPQQRAVSPHTRLCYKQTFVHFLHYGKGRFPACPDPDLEQLSVKLLLDFLTHLEKTRGNSASTRNTRLAALKSFFKMVALFDPRFQTHNASRFS